jgi:hypothetical protein
MVVCALCATATAQDGSSQRSSLTITASATDEHVRITAPSSIVQMHVEVYAAGGEKLFDQEIRGGNVFDWHLQDGQGQRLAPGSYVCVITAKSISGKFTQKIGTVRVETKSVSLRPAASSQLSVQQTQVIGPVEDNSSWTIPAKDDPQTPTVIANDGTDGQMIRGRGALTFRIGNFFTGNDTEQMRLTEAGNLGIGTSDPRSRLDVAGTIRAERFLMAKPKSNGVDKAATATDSVTTDSGDFQPLIMGSGTQDRLAKWTDNAGTLGDSGITETAGGLVGIGTTAPSAKLVVSTNSSTLPPAAGIARFADADGVQTTVFADSFGTNPIFNVRRANGTAAAPLALQANQLIGVIGASGYGASAYSGTRARVGFFASENWTNTANGTYLTFNTTANGTAIAGGTERIRIDSNGRVGIATNSPQFPLDVFGNINTLQNYYINGIRVISSPGGQNLFVGSNAGSTASGGSDTFVGYEAGFQTTGVNNSFFGDQAGFSNLTGSDNTVLGFFADVASSDLDHATAIGSGAVVSSSNTIALGRANGSDVVDVPGKLQIDTMGSSGGSPLCLNGSNRVALCMASSLRFKTQVDPFFGGLEIVSRLRPVVFTWKEDSKRDVGLAAEEVERVEPLFTLRNKQGEIEGVKYNQLSAIFINAFKEQQDQIAALRTANTALNARLRLIERTLKKKPSPTRQRR